MTSESRVIDALPPTLRRADGGAWLGSWVRWGTRAEVRADADRDEMDADGLLMLDAATDAA